MERSKTRPITIVVRPEVAAFAELMERKLLANDHKPHWRDNTPEWLLTRLYEEVEELSAALFCDEDPQHITDEATDVANFAMFIADVAGGLVLDTESLGSTIELNKNMSTTKDNETDIPVWRCPRCEGMTILADFCFCPSCGRRIEWMDWGLDGPKELEKTEPVDPFADVTDRYKIFCLAHGQESPTAMDRFVAEVGGPNYLLWLGSHMVAWKQARGFAPDHRMTHADHADFDAWLAEQVLGEAGGLGETAVTNSEHITRILDGLSKLGCGNHSCYFNPPQGIGTTGGCDCLNGLPFQLRRALIGLWMDRSGDKRGSETTD